MNGNEGDDCLHGMDGNDRLSGRMNAIDGTTDVVNCGRGDDVANADTGDDVSGNCETINRG